MEFEKLLRGLEKKPLIKVAYELLRTDLSPTLKYHNFEHTRTVLREVVTFALEDNLSAREIELVAIAAAFHDTGYVLNGIENEIHAAELSSEFMRKNKKYKKDEIVLVAQMILDTQLRFIDDVPRQISTIPLAGYLLDGDLGNFGRTDFFEKADLVRQETENVETKQFYSNLLMFLKAHKWNTKAAVKLRSAQKALNIKALEEKLNSGVFG